MNARKKVVLLIDDDQDTMGYMVDILQETRELEVVWLQSVDQVLETVPDMNYHIVILDIMMFWGHKKYTSRETQSGFQTGIRIFEDIFLAKGVPVIILTALAGENNRKAREYFKEQKLAVMFLEKPYSAIQLRNQIREILSAE